MTLRLLAEHEHAAAQHRLPHTTVEVPDERHHLHVLPPEEPDLRLGDIDGQIVLPRPKAPGQPYPPRLRVELLAHARSDSTYV
jgi:hypothetical protein